LPAITIYFIASSGQKKYRISGGPPMVYSSSNMINLDGPLTQIFVGFLLAIVGCVVIISAPEFSQISYLLFLIAGVLMALAMIFLAGD
jgi:glucan phosphoethanolaminetransferase (alkaline phosphatase superfamily)